MDHRYNYPRASRDFLYDHEENYFYNKTALKKNGKLPLNHKLDPNDIKTKKEEELNLQNKNQFIGNLDKNSFTKQSQPQ